MALIVTATVFGVTPKTKTEETGHHLHHESHSRHWKRRGTNISCCSDHDCAPVNAGLRQGQWFAQRRTDRIADLDEMQFKAFYRVWLGRVSLFKALQRREVRLDGTSADVRTFSGWFTWSPMADTVRAALADRPTASNDRPPKLAKRSTG